MHSPHALFLHDDDSFFRFVLTGRPGSQDWNQEWLRFDMNCVGWRICVCVGGICYDGMEPKSLGILLFESWWLEWDRIQVFSNSLSQWDNDCIRASSAPLSKQAWLKIENAIRDDCWKSLRIPQAITTQLTFPNSHCMRVLSFIPLSRYSLCFFGWYLI